jgi:GH25 family lysozyme M1 (1,4-beta-N-acetylmuramidase)
MPLHGIDVSEYTQRDPKNFAGLDFVIARVTMGASGIDQVGALHLLDARDAGVPLLGGYHYLRGDRPGAVQAEHLLARVSALESMIGVPIALSLDVEPPDGRPPWSVSVYRRALLDAVAELSVRTTRAVLIYGPGSYLPTLGIPEEIAARCPLWLADWTPPYPVPPPWTRAAIHQYAVTGGLDRNRSELSLDELRALLLPPPRPLSYDVLGPVMAGVRAAEGRGAGSVQDFVSRDEGPTIQPPRG